MIKAPGALLYYGSFQTSLLSFAVVAAGVGRAVAGMAFAARMAAVAGMAAVVGVGMIAVARRTIAAAAATLGTVTAVTMTTTTAGTSASAAAAATLARAVGGPCAQLFGQVGFGNGFAEQGFDGS